MTTASQPTTLQREEVLSILVTHQEELKTLGVKSLALFGSVARNEARPDSDVLVIAGLMVGNEFAVGAFVHPRLYTLDVVACLMQQHQVIR